MGVLDERQLKRMVRSVAEGWGQTVKAKRLERKWDLETVAEMVGVSVNTIKRIEAGELVPRDRVRWALAIALSTDVQKLFPPPSRERIASTREVA